MTDSELAAAIAEAVRPVWAELCIFTRLEDSGVSLDYDELDREWALIDTDDYGTQRMVVAPCWAAAILMHELERIFVGWTGQEFPRPHNLDAARAAHAKLKELLRAQS